MKFILVSKYGDGCHLLWQIKCEGNEVELYMTRKGANNWEGILPKAESLPLEKDAVYIFDTSGNSKIAESLLRRNYSVVCSSKMADDLEFDREYGLEIMKEIGIQIPESHKFKTCEEAANFLRGKKERYVFKPSGEGLPCYLSHVPEEGEDVSYYVEYISKTHSKEIESVEVQRFIEGVAISTEGWFNGFHFIRPFNHTIEKKKFLNDDLGPATGCAGNVVWTCDEDEIVHQLRKLEPFLQGKYIGPIDINMIVNEEGCYGLEWTPRFGYDALPALLPLFTDDVGKFLSDIVRNQFEGEMPLSGDYSAALRVSVPPYPEDLECMPYNMKESEIPGGLPINDVDEESDSYYFYEIMMQEDRLVHCDGFGVILCALAQGNGCKEAMSRAFDVAESLSIPNKSYRTDLDKVISNEYEEVMSCLTLKT